MDHQCKKCGSKFSINTRGRPPSLCFGCRGIVVPVNVSVVSTLAPTPTSIGNQSTSILVEEEPKPIEQPKPTGAYVIFVTNLGIAYSGDDEKEALSTYEKYVKASTLGYGQVGRELVSLIHNKETIKKFDPKVELV